MPAKLLLLWLCAPLGLISGPEQRCSIELDCPPVRLTRDGLEKYRPSWAPDGRRLLFGRRESDGSKIWQYVLDATKPASPPRRLTGRTAPEYNGAFSPDGTRVLFAAITLSGTQGNLDIAMVSADGSGLKTVSNDNGKLVHQDWPSWSPDGRRFAFSSTHDGNQEIYTAAADGTDLVRLTQSPAIDTHPSWSPDGRRIAFSTDRWGGLELASIGSDGTGLARLTKSPGLDDYPAYSPDGSRIAFVSNRDGQFEIYVVHSDGSGPFNLSRHALRDTFPTWTPDGRGVTFVSNRDGIADLYTQNVEPRAATSRPDAPPLYEVYAVRYATLRDFPVAALVQGADRQRKLDIAMTIWLLKGPEGRTILVDAGFYRRRLFEQWKTIADYTSPDKALARLGVKPEDVTDVVVTHMHWDHADGVDLFPKAQVWIQKDEFNYYTRNVKQPAGEEPVDHLTALVKLNALGRVHLVDGDAQEILPGVTVYTGGRHTYASQYVGVNTKAGRMVIASDNVYLYENLDKHVPIAQTLDAQANLAAQDRMKQLAADPSLIVPGHDPDVFARFPNPGNGVARLTLAAESPALKQEFERIVIDAQFPGAYQVEVADVNGDHRPDIVAVGGSTCAWYENPSWKKRVITGSAQTPGIISSATRDITGDGKAEVAIAYEFEMNRPARGKLLLASQGETVDSSWRLMPMSDFPSIHRLRWGDFDADRRHDLAVAPIFGPSAQPPRFDQEGASVVVFFFNQDSGGLKWREERTDSPSLVMHAIDVVDRNGDGRSEILAASNEGVSELARMGGASPKGAIDWRKSPIVEGAAGASPKRGSSEIHIGRLKGDRQFVATIEPWHGNEVVIHLGELANAIFGERTVIDDTLADGHALWVADVDGDGDDEVFAGHRGKDHRVSMYDFDRARQTWTRTVIDRDIAAQDLRGGDLDGDGTPDIVSVGGATHNVIWFRPKQRR